MVQSKIKGDTVTVRLNGELDHSSAPKVRQALDEAISPPKVMTLVLDLEGLTFMDSSGLGVIMGRYRSLARRNGRIAVKNVPGAVDRVFRLSGIYKIVAKL